MVLYGLIETQIHLRVIFSSNHRNWIWCIWQLVEQLWVYYIYVQSFHSKAKGITKMTSFHNHHHYYTLIWMFQIGKNLKHLKEEAWIEGICTIIKDRLWSLLLVITLSQFNNIILYGSYYLKEWNIVHSQSL